jgi:putative tricarboxylic transport membrane protein
MGMRDMQLNKDICSGAIFIAVAGLFASSAIRLPLGTAVRMGPGYFPLVLCAALAALGAITLIKGMLYATEAPTPAEWRGLILIILAVVAFALLIEPLGFLPALVITITLSLLASPLMTVGVGALLLVGLTGFCWAVFIWGIKLPWPLLGPWLAGY